ncbi:hypothetical protein Tco_0877463 [Tanacetum coccineum]|uniref:Uncharacterized protein n=1 Tax=Tanacetum coccineum TaxID=301880 RepID=A0ABQ5BXQ3_9ASTR
MDCPGRPIPPSCMLGALLHPLNSPGGVVALSSPRRPAPQSYTGTLLLMPPLSVIKTALVASLAAARYMISSSFSFGAVSIGSSAMSFFICLKANFAPAGPEIIAHSIGMTLLLRIVTVPPFTGNFNISLCVMAYGTDLSYTRSAYYSIVLDGDLITMKFIHAEVECSSSPIFTSRDIWPIGQIVSPLNPMSDVVTGIIWLLISGWSLAKQCSYRTSEDAPPSTYIRYTKCPLFQLR